MRPPAVVMWTGVAVLLLLNIVVGAIIFVVGALMAVFSLTVGKPQTGAQE